MTLQVHLDELDCFPMQPDTFSTQFSFCGAELCVNGQPTPMPSTQSENISPMDASVAIALQQLYNQPPCDVSRTLEPVELHQTSSFPLCRLADIKLGHAAAVSDNALQRHGLAPDLAFAAKNWILPGNGHDFPSGLVYSNSLSYAARNLQQDPECTPSSGLTTIGKIKEEWAGSRGKLNSLSFIFEEDPSSNSGSREEADRRSEDGLDHQVASFSPHFVSDGSLEAMDGMRSCSTTMSTSEGLQEDGAKNAWSFIAGSALRSPAVSTASPPWIHDEVGSFSTSGLAHHKCKNVTFEGTAGGCGCASFPTMNVAGCDDLMPCSTPMVKMDGLSPRIPFSPGSSSSSFPLPTKSKCHALAASHLPSGIEKPAPLLSSAKEMLYRAAAFRPIDIASLISSKPKTRKNVKISKDPQTVAARHRRARISDRIRILQKIVPGGTKMDTASMLDEAVKYLKFLKTQVNAMQSRLNCASTGFCEFNQTTSSEDSLSYLTS